MLICMGSSELLVDAVSLHASARKMSMVCDGHIVIVDRLHTVLRTVSQYGRLPNAGSRPSYNMLDPGPRLLPY
jgi:hypothetical protein